MDYKEDYNIYHYNSGNDEISELESILEKIHNNDNYTLISQNDSILPSGSYVAVIHYTTRKEVIAANATRISATSDL